MERQNVFIFGERWFSYEDYVIKKVDGFECIMPNHGIKKEEVKHYVPMENKQEINRPNNKEELIENSPHVHLANIDVNNQDEILHFVNTWGLLGLWRVQKYSEAFTLPGKILNVGLDGERYSSWFENLHVKFGKLRWMEPLPIFRQAVIDYQTLFKELEYARNAIIEPDSIVNTELKFKQMLSGITVKPRWDNKTRDWAMDWEFKSLLDLIYLRTLFDFQNKSFARCIRERCSKVFVNTKSSNQFCSDQCKSRYYVEQKRKRDKINALKSHFPEVDEEWLETEIENLINQGVQRKSQLFKQIKLLTEPKSND
jgi:hypothetical protein